MNNKSNRTTYLVLCQVGQPFSAQLQVGLQVEHEPHRPAGLVRGDGARASDQVRVADLASVCAAQTPHAEIERVLGQIEGPGDGRLHRGDGLRRAEHLVLAILQRPDETGVRLQMEVRLGADLKLALNSLHGALN